MPFTVHIQASTRKYILLYRPHKNWMLYFFFRQMLLTISIFSRLLHHAYYWFFKKYFRRQISNIVVKSNQTHICNILHNAKWNNISPYRWFKTYNYIVYWWRLNFIGKHIIYIICFRQINERKLTIKLLTGIFGTTGITRYLEKWMSKVAGSRIPPSKQLKTLDIHYT